MTGTSCSRALRGAPARSPATSSNGLVSATVDRAHQQRLQHAFVADRLRQRVELRLVKLPARLQGAGPDQLDRQPGAGAPLRRWRRLVSPNSAARPRPSGRRLRLAHDATIRGGAGRRGAASRRRAGYRPARRRSDVVEQHRLAVRRRLGHPHIARDHRVDRPCRRNARARRRRPVRDRLLRSSYMVSTTPCISSRGLSARAPARSCASAGSSLRARRIRIAAAPEPLRRDQRVDGQQVQGRRAIDQHLVIAGRPGATDRPAQQKLASLARSAARIRRRSDRPRPERSRAGDLGRRRSPRRVGLAEQ